MKIIYNNKKEKLYYQVAFIFGISIFLFSLLGLGITFSIKIRSIYKFLIAFFIILLLRALKYYPNSI
jgi:hypothetical protein